LEINELETKHLTWIHSNKFTTPELFHKRFILPKTYRQACSILRDQYLKKGLLGMTKAESTTFQDSMYFLTTQAIQILDEAEKILVKRTNYPVRVNPYERQHDLEVQAIRIAFERNKQLGRIFWLSDFEMRAGITQAVKKTFLKGELDKEQWRSHWTNTQIKGRRTPDGYFETDLDGKRYGFTLEYEHVQNPDAKIGRMIEYLGDSFPTALRLVVSANKKNAARMKGILRSKINERDWPHWFVSDYEMAISLPFKKIWSQLNNQIDE
jgi:hypothetical protein